jgi:hypothetical protein
MAMTMASELPEAADPEADEAAEAVLEELHPAKRLTARQDIRYFLYARIIFSPFQKIWLKYRTQKRATQSKTQIISENRINNFK